MKNHLLVGRSDLSNFVIGAIKFNNSYFYNNYEKLSTSSVKVSFYDIMAGENYNKSAPFKYDVNLKISNSELTVTNSTACFSFNDITEASYKNCFTYFNYTNNKTICRCHGEVEVASILNTTLANYAKLFQFPKWSWELFNPISICFIFSSLTIIIFYSVFLLIYDLRQDKYDNLNTVKLTDKEYVKKEFEFYNLLGRTNILTFGVFITMYLYPFVSVITFYHYDQPRLLKFLVEILKILITFCMSLLPYYFTSFTRAQSFMDSRNIEESNLSVDNLPINFTDLIINLIYTTISGILISLVLFVINCLLKWDKVLNLVFNKKKKLIENYVKKYHLTPSKMKSKWILLRTNIQAFALLYKKWIDKKIGKSRRKYFFKNTSILYEQVATIDINKNTTIDLIQSSQMLQSNNSEFPDHITNLYSRKSTSKRFISKHLYSSEGVTGKVSYINGGSMPQSSNNDNFYQNKKVDHIIYKKNYGEELLQEKQVEKLDISFTNNSPLGIQNFLELFVEDSNDYIGIKDFSIKNNLHENLQNKEGNSILTSPRNEEENYIKKYIHLYLSKEQNICLSSEYQIKNSNSNLSKFSFLI
jgi:hypothetical protein